MAKPDKAKKDHVANQIQNCQKQLDHLQEIIDNPDSTEEQINEAMKSLQDQTAKMQRLTGGQATP